MISIGATRSKDVKADIRAYFCGIKCNGIEIDSEVWEEWKDYRGKFEYYKFGHKCRHKGICIRPIDHSRNTIRIDLNIVDADRKTWVAKVQSSKWDPAKFSSKGDTCFSSHEWHSGSVIRAVHDFGQKFKRWHIVFNNCGNWVNGVIKYLQNEHETYSDEEQITTKEKLREVAQKYNLKIKLIETIN